MTGLFHRFSPIKKTTATWIMALAVILTAALTVHAAEEADDQFLPLQQSIEESLQVEKNLLAGLEQERDRIRELEPTLAAELEDYRILQTTYTNMLAQQMPDPNSLEQADTRVKAALIHVRERLDTFNRQYDAIRPLQTGLDEQLAINTAYLKEVRKSRNKNSEYAEFTRHLEALVDLITQKRQYLTRMHDFYQSSIEKLNATQEDLLSLSTKLDTRLNDSRQSSLLTRRVTLLPSDGRETLLKETNDLTQQLMRLVSFEYLRNEFDLMWKSASSLLAIPVLLFLLIIMLAFRLRRFHLKMWEKPAIQNCPAFRLAWQTFNRSIFLLVITAFLFICAQIGAVYVPAHIAILLLLLQIFLFTQWALNIINGAAQAGLINIQPAFQKRLRFLSSILIRCYLTIYVVMSYASQSGSVLLSWSRLVFEVLLIAWCLEFWKTDRRLQAPASFTRHRIVRKEAVKLLTYVMSFGGLAFEVTGYGGMSFFWYAAWGRTIVIGFWAALLYGALQELSAIYQVDPDNRKEDEEPSGAPVTWLFLKLGQPLVLILFLMAVILAWGGKRAFLIALFDTIGKTYRIGSIKFSIIGFVYALAVLLITHIIAQTWRHVFQHKLLARSGMVLGLQESLTTISIYVLWVLGTLISLSFIGLNTTSLAVAFGALGIGLGFGLQNIVNNFISGIILLLERPIQVGDDIQLSNIWATVKKINIRSTVVQTYDNASVIIPNSELISNQVINWSFNDNRLRRSITIGVAYGSDIELVRQTLLEAAASVPRVLKQPGPDVVFKDFGDSALIFSLRIWTQISYYLSVETEVRFAIDRLFRERNISIPFPQRDIHIYNQNPPPATD